MSREGGLCQDIKNFTMRAHNVYFVVAYPVVAMVRGAVAVCAQVSSCLQVSFATHSLVFLITAG